MLESVLPALYTIAQSMVEKAFAATITEKLKAPLLAMKADHAKSRAALQVLESIQPFFSIELSSEDAAQVVAALHDRLTHISILPASLATAHFDVDVLLASTASKYSVNESTMSPHQKALLDRLTKTVVVSGIEISRILPDWERLAWAESFKALDGLARRVNDQTTLIQEMRNEPKSRALEFEADYKRVVRGEYSRVQIRGLGNIGEIKALSLDVLYVGMSLARFATETDRFSRATAAGALNTSIGSPAVPETTNILSVLRTHPRFVLLGAPGAGKSTAVQFLAMRAALGDTSDSSQTLSDLVPFLVRVKSLADFAALPSAQTLASLSCPLLASTEASELSLAALRSGRALVIIDGLDECEIEGAGTTQPAANPIQSERKRLVEWIEGLAKAYPHARIVATARPVGYRIGELSAAGFAEYQLLPLSSVQQESFVNQWCLAVERTMTPDDAADAVSRAKIVATDLMRRVDQAKSVRSLAYNPLMLSVICILHRYRGERLPERRIDLLNECLNVLLYDWRSAQGVKKSVIGDLDSRQLRSLLEPLAWKMTLEGRDQVSEDELVAIFHTHLPELSQPTSRALQITTIIRDRTGVLVEIGPKTYAFMHLLFQEYLAAAECARRRDAYDLLLTNANNPRWREIIPMAVAAVPGNQEMLIRGLLHKEALELAVACVNTLDRISPLVRDEVAASLARAGSELRKDFSKESLERLVAVGTIQSTVSILKLLTSLPTAVGDQYGLYAANYNFGDTPPQSLESLCEAVVNRIATYKDLYLGRRYGPYVNIGYGPDDDSAGLSWLSQGIGLCIPYDLEPNEVREARERLPANHLEQDPLYNYAVLLDVGNNYRTTLAEISWPAFKSIVESQPTASESLLLALHYVWYFASANQWIRELLLYIQSLPAGLCPAFQLGIINNAMSRVEPERRQDVLPLATKLWRERAIAHSLGLCKLFQYWYGGFHDENNSPYTPQTAVELSRRFSSRFQEKLLAQSPFQFGEVTNGGQ